MKPLSFIVACLTFSLFICASPKNGFSQKTSFGGDIEKLKKLEYGWLVAEFKRDTASISTMMDDRFMSVGLTGISTKQQELDGIYQNISERLKNGHVVDSLYLDDVRIQIYENTAVVTFFSVTKGRIKEVPFENRRTRMYDVWIKRKGRWKAISSQVTPIH